MLGSLAASRKNRFWDSPVPILQRLPRGRFRNALRARTLDAFTWSTEFAGRTQHGLDQSRVHFIYLHGIAPGEEGALRALLQDLRQRNQFISYSEAVDRLLNDRIDGRYIALSFDDGFASCVVAASILSQEGVTACFFVCPDIVDKGHSDLLKMFPRGCGTETRAMTWGEIKALQDAGHEIGSHTMSHPVLAEVSRQEAAEQIFRSREVLATRLGEVRHFAWPRGQFHHFTPDGAVAVWRAGYQSCASAERGCHTVGADKGLFPCIRRDHVDLSWPLRHVRYFLGRAARRSSSRDNRWPPEWELRDWKVP